LATNVSGTLAVANGGTGAATLTGLVKGNGTGAMTAAVAGTDYVAPSGSITGNAATVTTNANLTGPITSSGNTTSVASQTGTGSTFVMNTSPTLVTPVLGVATATSINSTTIPTSKTLVVTTDKLNVMSSTSSTELAGVISDETGSGSVVLSASPTLTGTPLAPTATAGTNTTQVATTAFVTNAISNGSAANVTGTVAIANGGTGATTATAALANLTGTQSSYTVLAGPSSTTSTLVTYDGSSLAGWTTSGGTTIDSGVGNPGSSFKVTGSNQSCYRDFGQSLKNKVIKFDVRLTSGVAGFSVGGPSNMGLRIITGTSSQNGLKDLTTWMYPQFGVNTYTFAANTWYSIKIVTDNGAVGGTTWYVNEVLVGNSGSIAMGNGTTFGIVTDGATAYYDNITIIDNSNSGATPTFRALVAEDIPTLNQNTTGNAATATSATSATNANNTAITDDATTATAVYPTFVTANTGNLPQKVTRLNYLLYQAQEPYQLLAL